MVMMVNESQATGANTLDMLNTQAEQINRIENNLDTINAEMKEADKALTGMEKWCGLFVCPWNRSAAVGTDDSAWETTEEQNQTVRRQPGPGDRDTADTVMSGPYVQRITNDSREDEMEQNMQGVGNILGNLKNMATDMGDEIERQNKHLDLIQGKTHGADIRIEQANKRTEK